MITWNCHGLGNPRAVIALKNLNKSWKPVFVFLCETLVNSNKLEEIKRVIGFSNCFCVDKDGRSGGLALLWNNTISISILSYSLIIS